MSEITYIADRYGPCVFFVVYQRPGSEASSHTIVALDPKNAAEYIVARWPGTIIHAIRMVFSIDAIVLPNEAPHTETVSPI